MEDGDRPRLTTNVSSVEMDAEASIDTLARLHERIPQWTLGMVWLQWLPALCPLSLSTDQDSFLLARETEMREYHLPYYAGGLADQPQKVLEGFAAIREGRGQREMDRLEEQRIKMNSKD